jgi:GNAT superfamily N-acetyltransferase
MATHADFRGRGIGAMVRKAMTDHVAAQGGHVIWTWSEVFEVASIGPHAVM